MPRKSNRDLPPARCAAFSVLNAVLRHGVDAQTALDNQLHTVSLDSRDKALATELTYGYLRHKGRIDFILNSFFAKLGKLPPLCIFALGLATYERLFLERVPEYATRSWLTNFVRKNWGSGLSRLATAYMTTLDGHLPDLHAEDFYRQDACSFDEFLSRYYSLPLWIVSLWLRAYGNDRTQTLAEIQLLPAFLGLRINPLHPGAHELIKSIGSSFDLRKSSQWGIACERNQSKFHFPNLDMLMAQGRLSRQSLAGQHVLDSLHLETAQGPVWDVCSGRGGKTCYLLERTTEPVLASDSSWPRLKGLCQEIARLGLRNIPVALARADRNLPWREKPGYIVIDAPCSGFGVLARRPDIKWKRTPADLRQLEILQRHILQVAAASLRQAGHLLYITCTMNPAENEHQIDLLLREHSGLRCLDLYPGQGEPDFREFYWAALLEKK